MFYLHSREDGNLLILLFYFYSLGGGNRSRKSRNRDNYYPDPTFFIENRKWDF